MIIMNTFSLHAMVHTGCPKTFPFLPDPHSRTGMFLIRKTIIVPVSPDQDEAEARS